MELISGSVSECCDLSEDSLSSTEINRSILLRAHHCIMSVLLKLLIWKYCVSSAFAVLSM